MAVKARDSITLFHQTDIYSVTWYYLLQSSTATPPTKPTTDPPPSGWTTAEPTYTEGSTNSLYIVEKTVFSDGSFAYSNVSLSTSYEAAKAAYNKAVQSAQTATRYIADVTNGINVHPEGDTTTGWRITNVLEMLKSGVSYIWAGLVNGVATLRLGNKNGGNSYLEIAPNKISAASANQTSYYEVGDVAGTTLTESFVGDGETIEFTISYRPVGEVPNAVMIDGVEDHTYTVGLHGRRYRFSTAPSAGSVIEITYVVDPSHETEGRYFTFGTRAAGRPPGDNSVSFGLDNTVLSCNFGYGQGLYTASSSRFAVFTGTYNDPYAYNSLALLVIGNGTSDDNRSNALVVDSDGNLDCANHKVGCSEKGTDGYWTWYKYDDGSFDMYRTITSTISHYYALNGFYFYYISGVNFPSGCKPVNSAYYVQHDWTIGSGNFAISAGVLSRTTTGFNVYACSNTSGSKPCTVIVHVHGNWK